MTPVAAVPSEPGPPVGTSASVAQKRKVSVSLDGDILAELEAEGVALSSQVNEALRNEMGRRRRHRMLAELLGDLEATHGPPDEELVHKYMDLLA